MKVVQNVLKHAIILEFLKSNDVSIYLILGVMAFLEFQNM